MHLTVDWEEEVRRRCPRALGCGRLSSDETRWVWWAADPADGETALRLLAETFRVLRMYRLGLPTLRLEMAMGTLWAHQGVEGTFAVLLPTGSSTAALEQVGLLENVGTEANDPARTNLEVARPSQSLTSSW